MRVLGILSMALALAASGCASTMKDVYAAKDRGTSVVYPVPAERAWAVVDSLLYDVAREAPEDHRDHGFECARGGLGDDETLIGVWVEPRDDPRDSRVTVVVRRAMGAQIAVVITEKEFHERFRKLAGLRAAP